VVPAREWSYDSPRPERDTIEVVGEGLEWGGYFTETWWGTVLAIFGTLLLVLIFFVFLPLAFAVVGLFVAFAVLGARLLSIAPWIVIAWSRRAWLEWQVRGTFRSARAMREVAAGLERGDEWPMVDGRLPVVVESRAVPRGSPPPARTN
jgi:hypothetical protein